MSLRNQAPTNFMVMRSYSCATRTSMLATIFLPRAAHSTKTSLAGRLAGQFEEIKYFSSLIIKGLD